MRETAPPPTILILAAGEFASANDRDEYPPCLTDIGERPLIEHIVANAGRVAGARFLYALRDSDVRKHHLDSVIELLTPGAGVVRVPDATHGAACVAMLAACDVPADGELLIISASELVSADLAEIIGGFRGRGADAGVITFRSVHPRYSYVRLDEESRVTEAAHRNPISHHATTGIFWFARASDFTHAVKNMIRKDAHVDGLFSICPALNEMILKRATVVAAAIPPAAHRRMRTDRGFAPVERRAAAGGR